MKIRRFISFLFLGIFIAASLAFLMPQTVHAQCGLPGTPPCPPKKKTPTAPRPTPTSTPTVTSTPTSRATPCSVNAGNPYANCPTPPPCFSISGSGNSQCTPTPTLVGLPATGGGGPSPFGMMTAGLIIVVCFGGGLFIWFRSRSTGGGSPQADDLNPQPLPPKGMGDGSNQFQKADDQFEKMTMGGGSHVELNPQPLPPKQGDAASQFQKADDQLNKIYRDGGQGHSGEPTNNPNDVNK